MNFFFLRFFFLANICNGIQRQSFVAWRFSHSTNKHTWQAPKILINFTLQWKLYMSAVEVLLKLYINAFYFNDNFLLYGCRILG